MIIKEKQIQCKRFTLRRDTCKHTFQYFNELYEEALKDFPNLEMAKVIVTRFGGKPRTSVWNTFGIEFISEGDHESYKEVPALPVQF